MDQDPAQLNEDPAKAELTLGIENSTTKENFRNRDQRRISQAYQDALSTPKGKTIVTGLITVVIIALLIFLAIAPALGSINNQLQVNDVLRTDISKMDAKISNLLVLSSTETKSKDSLTLFDTYLGTDKHEGEIYTNLENLVSQSSLNFKSVIFDSTNVKIKKYSTLNLPPKTQFQTVKLTVTGSLTNLTKLISSIEASKRNYDIAQIDVTTPDKANSGQIQADIVIYTIFWAATPQAP